MMPQLTIATTDHPVVVELFESQGCSSCPPAERTMERLKADFGERIIPMVFHVDYWDSLGWKDTFSSAENTERQKMYGEALGQSSIYTPEMVIGGETGFNGADTDQARAEIQKRLTAPGPVLALQTELISPTKLRVTIRSKDPAVQGGTVQGVLTEDAPPVKVLRGENRGETMSGAAAVRRHFNATPVTEGVSTFTIERELSWDPHHLRIAVWINTRQPKIIAAQHTGWPAT